MSSKKRASAKATSGRPAGSGRSSATRSSTTAPASDRNSTQPKGASSAEGAEGAKGAEGAPGARKKTTPARNAGKQKPASGASGAQGAGGAKGTGAAEAAPATEAAKTGKGVKAAKAARAAEGAANGKVTDGAARATAEPGTRPPSGPRPARLTVAAALAALEGAALAVIGVYVLVMGVAGHPHSPAQAETLGVTVLALAALPLSAARGLWLLRRWSRGPALITQLMALPVAWTLVENGGLLLPAGLVIGVVALAGLVALINPTATEALGIGPRDASPGA